MYISKIRNKQIVCYHEGTFVVTFTSTPAKTVRGPLPKMAYFSMSGMFSYRVCTKLTGWLRVKVRAPVP